MSLADKLSLSGVYKKICQVKFELNDPEGAQEAIEKAKEDSLASDLDIAYFKVHMERYDEALELIDLAYHQAEKLKELDKNTYSRINYEVSKIIISEVKRGKFGSAKKLIKKLEKITEPLKENDSCKEELLGLKLFLIYYELKAKGIKPAKEELDLIFESVDNMDIYPWNKDNLYILIGRLQNCSGFKADVEKTAGKLGSSWKKSSVYRGLTDSEPEIIKKYDKRLEEYTDDVIWQSESDFKKYYNSFSIENN